MTTLSIRLSLFAFTLAAIPACDEPAAQFGAGDVDDRCVYCNGIKLNTNKIGAHIFSEIDTTGDKHDGVRLNFVELKFRGTKLDSVWAEAGQLMGRVNITNTVYGGQLFDDSIWHMSIESSPGVWTDATMTITDVRQDANTYGWKYTFFHTYIGGPKEFTPNCDKDDNTANGEEFDAIVTGNITVDLEKAKVSDRPNTLFIGCVSGGVGKAGMWGYPKHKIAGNPAFTAAIRMVRADYCGTGHSFTVPGQKLTVTDTYGYNSLSAAYTTEALWNLDGAACVHNPRLVGEYPDAETVMHICGELGGKVPAECKANASLATVPNSLYMSANPI